MAETERSIVSELDACSSNEQRARVLIQLSIASIDPQKTILTNEYWARLDENSRRSQLYTILLNVPKMLSDLQVKYPRRYDYQNILQLCEVNAEKYIKEEISQRSLGV